MAKRANDEAAIGTVETSETVTISAEEYARLRAGAAPPNPAPAVESGPHLRDPDLAAAKAAQLRDAGVTGQEDWLTDDMRAALEREG